MNMNLEEAIKEILNNFDPGLDGVLEREDIEPALKSYAASEVKRALEMVDVNISGMDVEAMTPEAVAAAKFLNSVWIVKKAEVLKQWE